MATNKAKNNADEPRSFSITMTTIDMAHAATNGPMARARAASAEPGSAAGRQQFAPLDEVAGEEDRQRDLGQLAGLEAERAHL